MNIESPTKKQQSDNLGRGDNSFFCDMLFMAVVAIPFLIFMGNGALNFLKKKQGNSSGVP